VAGGAPGRSAFADPRLARRRRDKPSRRLLETRHVDGDRRVVEGAHAREHGARLGLQAGRAMRMPRLCAWSTKPVEAAALDASIICTDRRRRMNALGGVKGSDRRRPDRRRGLRLDRFSGAATHDRAAHRRGARARRRGAARADVSRARLQRFWSGIFRQSSQGMSRPG
jgi:hypothetical protein